MRSFVGAIGLSTRIVVRRQPAVDAQFSCLSGGSVAEARRRLSVFETALVDSLVLRIHANLRRGSYDVPDAALALASVAQTASTYLITGDAGVGKSTRDFQSQKPIEAVLHYYQKPILRLAACVALEITRRPEAVFWLHPVPFLDVHGAGAVQALNDELALALAAAEHPLYVQLETPSLRAAPVGADQLSSYWTTSIAGRLETTPTAMLAEQACVERSQSSYIFSTIPTQHSPSSSIRKLATRPGLTPVCDRPFSDELCFLRLPPPGAT